MSEIRTRRIPRESAAKKADLPAAPQAAETAVPASVAAPEIPEPELSAVQPAELAEAEVVTIEPLPVLAVAPTIRPPTTRASKSSDRLDAILEAQKIVVQGCDEVFETLTGLVKTGLAASRDAGIALLDARTVFDAIAVNVELSNRAVGVLVEGSCRLSEIGCKTAASASRSLTHVD